MSNNLDTMDELDQHMKELERKDFNQEDFEFYEQIVHGKMFVNVEPVEKVDQHMDTLEGDDCNWGTPNWETINDKKFDSEMSFKSEIFPIQDLPEEVILKVFSNLVPKDLLRTSQVSKRFQRISRDKSLWERVNLSNKIVKSKFIKLILNMGCKSLNLKDSSILGRLKRHKVSRLRKLELSNCTADDEFLETLLDSCCDLQYLALKGAAISNLVTSICQNGQTLEKLNLSGTDTFGSDQPDQSYLQIIKRCQKLREVNFSQISLSADASFEIESLAKNITPNIERLELDCLDVTDYHIKILLRRCKKIKEMNLNATWITDASLKNIKENLDDALEELSLCDMNYISLSELPQLKSMKRLKLLKLSTSLTEENEGDEENEENYEIKNLRQQLPSLRIEVED